ncbi:MAG: nitrogen regulation protein NR(I) [Pseudomonadota bacterium]
MNARIKAWVVDDDHSLRWVLEQALGQSGIDTRSFETADSVLDALGSETPDVLMTDVRMPGKDGLQLLDELANTHAALPVIIMTAHSDLDTAVKAYRGGAFEYLPKPFDVDDAVQLVARAAREATVAVNDDFDPSIAPRMVGQAPAMQDVFRAIGRLAKTSLTVMITGESGTGKELVARALHENSPRHEAPFVALNMSAIPAELLESELFGHERGAFTGAETRRIGRFEQADGGTLFLDEIGDMSLDLQTRLLRVLAEGEFYRVGGQTAVKVDVRVIAATNKTLEKSVSAGEFREDLYHRLNVIRIESPPLRERREDIPRLIDHYLSSAATELETERKQLDPAAMQKLVDFDWPGNVRQLVNFCRRLTVTAPGNNIGLDDLPAELRDTAPGTVGQWQSALAAWAAGAAKTPPPEGLTGVVIPDCERILIRAALAAAGGHRQEAARLLGWGRNTLTRKIQSLGI